MIERFDVRLGFLPEGFDVGRGFFSEGLDADMGFLPEGLDVVFGFLPEGFDVASDAFDIVFGGEMLFDYLHVLPHDDLGLMLGHAGFHQFVDGGMGVKDDCRGRRHGVNDCDCDYVRDCIITVPS